MLVSCHRLAYNNLHDEGTLVLCNALRESTVSKIQEVGLQKNGIGVVGATAIARLCAVRASLTTLSLANNMLSGIGGEYSDGSGALRGTFSSEGIAAITDAMSKSQSLTVVDL